MRSFPLFLIGFLLVLPVHAASYHDPVWPVSVNAPAGWRLYAVKEQGVRKVKARAPLAEDRERGGVRVEYIARRPERRDALSRIASRYRKAEGAREAATQRLLDEKRGRLWLDYRQGEYVQNGLWIVRRHWQLWQRSVDGKVLYRADCSANASEFAKYRRAFDNLCRRMSVGGR